MNINGIFFNLVYLAFGILFALGLFCISTIIYFWLEEEC